MWLWKIAEKISKPEYAMNHLIEDTLNIHTNHDDTTKALDPMTEEQIMEILSKVLYDNEPQTKKIVN